MKFNLINYLLALITFACCSFACQKENGEAMTVIKDCTGTYLRFENKDYHVCNNEKVSAFDNGTKVSVIFKKLNDCKQQNNTIVCMMYHENEGWIEVESINK